MCDLLAFSKFFNAPDASKTRGCAGIVGHADVACGAPVEEVLKAMIGAGRGRDIRFITASHPDQAPWAR
jgi:L-fuconolactonase